MTCWSCIHIRRTPHWLCALTGESEPMLCGRFEYEPGSDEAERGE